MAWGHTHGRIHGNTIREGGPKGKGWADQRLFCPGGAGR